MYCISAYLGSWVTTELTDASRRRQSVCTLGTAKNNASLIHINKLIR